MAREDLATTFQFNDIDGSVHELPLPNLMVRISEQSLRTLACVDQQGGETTLPELAATAERSKNTLGRHLNELETADAVETGRDGKTRHVRLTLSGELRLYGHDDFVDS